MKHYLAAVFALLIFTLLSPVSSLAEPGEKMVIALETDDFKLAETDISSLAIGEAKTIETDSGRIVDILRTGEGVEIYVDGELLEMNFNNPDLHEDHIMIKHLEIECDDGDACDENITILDQDEHDAAAWVTADGQHIEIRREIEVTCNTGEQGEQCNEQVILISGDGDIDMEQLHEIHGDGEEHKVIVIKKHLITED